MTLTRVCLSIFLVVCLSYPAVRVALVRYSAKVRIDSVDTFIRAFGKQVDCMNRNIPKADHSF